MDDPSDEISCCILHTHNTLLRNHTYLGDPNFLQYVQWRRRGRKNLLYALPSSKNSNTSDSIATLSIIAFIPDDTFWLTSDAGWKGPTKITPTLSKAKATCITTFPDDDTILRDDFQHALDHIHALQDMVVTPGAESRLRFSLPGSTKLKLRHVLFEVLYLLHLYLARNSSRKSPQMITT